MTWEKRIEELATATTVLLESHLRRAYEDGVAEGIRREAQRRELVREHAREVAQRGAGDPA